MMEIKVRHVSQYKEYKLKDDNVTIESSLLYPDEARKIAKEMLFAASELLDYDSSKMVSEQISLIAEAV
jgi:hypothetical protein